MLNVVALWSGGRRSRSQSATLFRPFRDGADVKLKSVTQRVVNARQTRGVQDLSDHRIDSRRSGALLEQQIYNLSPSIDFMARKDTFFDLALRIGYASGLKLSQVQINIASPNRFLE